MSFKLTTRDLEILKGVHPDLVRVIVRAAEISPEPFVVIEGLRSIDRQKMLVATGKSKTMKSRHLRASNGFGHAVDIAPIVNGKPDFADWKNYRRLAPYIKQAAKLEKVLIEWGGDWKSFPDGPHWQLPWASYSSKSTAIASFADLSGSRTVQGSTVAALGGSTFFAESIFDLKDKLLEAQSQLTTGDYFSVIIGATIIVGGLYALYARWDDAGRPMPFKKSISFEKQPEFIDREDFTETEGETE
jgi:peptidoglycan L-alanyl-D-glutamate endopeptidase CwlK